MTFIANVGGGLATIHSNGLPIPTPATHAYPPLIPSNARVRGVNIAPPFSWRDTPDQGSAWSAMWRVWDWAGNIKLQLDDAATIANCVRTLGSPFVVTSGNITLATYLARWEQFLDYCVAKNLYVYPCGGDFAHWGPNTTYDAATEIYTAWSDLLARYGNIVGVDVVGEAWNSVQGNWNPPTSYSQPERYVDVLNNLLRIVRRHAGVPVTNSMSITSAGQWTLVGTEQFPLWKQFELSDFIDIHCYVDSATPELVAAYMRQPWCANKQLIIGEIGGQDPSAASWVARYTDAATIVASSAGICGALAWSNWDLGTGTNNLSGLFNASRVLRTGISVPFATIPTTR